MCPAPDAPGADAPPPGADAPPPGAGLPRVVLHRTLYAGNVGSTARAMANMGLRDLRIVAPRYQSDRSARQMATGSAEDLLQAATVHENLEQALGDCTLVIALTARPRTWKAWPCLAPQAAAELAVQRQDESVAFLFGAEDNGLELADLAWATHLCHIPTAPEHSSLNLAQAVLLMGWEWASARGRITRRPRRNRKREAATLAQVQGAAEQAGALLDSIDYWAGRSREQGLATLRQTLLRGEMTDTEIHYLRGVLGKLQWFVSFGPRLPPQERERRREERKQRTARVPEGTEP